MEREERNRARSALALAHAGGAVRGWSDWATTWRLAGGLTERGSRVTAAAGGGGGSDARRGKAMVLMMNVFVSCQKGESEMEKGSCRDAWLALCWCGGSSDLSLSWCWCLLALLLRAGATLGTSLHLLYFPT